MQVAVLFFEGITALDAIGPYEVLQRVPGADVKFVAKQAGAVRTDDGRFLALVADYALHDVTEADVLLVPGGFGTRALMNDDEVLDWVRAIDATTTWTTSVCTGALVLGAAGLLRGLEATTYWTELERLREFGAIPTGKRVVEQGKIVTAAGVSSGIDMALTLVGRMYGDVVARAIQLSIEYDPQPPFDAGSPEKAGPEIVDLVRQAIAAASRPTTPV